MPASEISRNGYGRILTERESNLAIKTEVVIVSRVVPGLVRSVSFDAPGYSICFD